MSDNFDIAIKVILFNEGGLTENPYDRGGSTNYGITFNTLVRAVKEGIVPRETTIESLTKEQAIDIYRAFFWDKLKLNNILTQSIATKILDTTVNLGLHWGIIVLQRAVHAATGSKLNEDGILGPNTLKAVNSAPSACLLSACRSEQAGYYRSIVANDSSQQVFINGWLRRAYS